MKLLSHLENSYLSYHLQTKVLSFVHSVQTQCKKCSHDLLVLLIVHCDECSAEKFNYLLFLMLKQKMPLINAHTIYINMKNNAEDNVFQDLLQ